MYAHTQNCDKPIDYLSNVVAIVWFLCSGYDIISNIAYLCIDCVSSSFSFLNLNES